MWKREEAPHRISVSRRRKTLPETPHTPLAEAGSHEQGDHGLEGDSNQSWLIQGPWVREGPSDT